MKTKWKENFVPPTESYKKFGEDSTVTLDRNKIVTVGKEMNISKEAIKRACEAWGNAIKKLSL